MRGVPKSVEVLRQKVVERGGLNGLRSFARMFKIFDDSGDGYLNESEFKAGLADYGISLSVDELKELWSFIDRYDTIDCQQADTNRNYWYLWRKGISS